MNIFVDQQWKTVLCVLLHLLEPVNNKTRSGVADTVRSVRKKGVQAELVTLARRMSKGQRTC